jgi:hypothetical protein
MLAAAGDRCSTLDRMDTGRGGNRRSFDFGCAFAQDDTFHLERSIKRMFSLRKSVATWGIARSANGCVSVLFLYLADV